MTRRPPAASPPREAATTHARRNAAAAVLSLGANFVLLVAKLVVGLVTGSVAVLSEAANSAGDVVASGIALTTVRAAARPPDREHPYGHERAENVGSAAEGLLIVGAGAYVAVEAVTRLAGGGEEVLHLELAIAVMVAAVVVDLVVAARLRAVARRTGSPAIAGDAAHLESDVWTTGGAAAGLIVVAATGWDVLDPIIGLAVAGWVVWIGVRITWQAAQVLVDRNLPAGDLEVVGRVLGDFAGEGVSFHAVRGRRAGAKRHLDLHMVVPPETTVRRGHEMTGEVKGALVAALPGTDVLIHLEDHPRPGAEAEGAREG
jgi:cation diffusion facilitator family transporter